MLFKFNAVFNIGKKISDFCYQMERNRVGDAQLNVSIKVQIDISMHLCTSVYTTMKNIRNCVNSEYIIFTRFLYLKRYQRGSF